MADLDFVRIELADKHRLKLRFRHKDLRDAVHASGKPFMELLNDKFGGWPYLLLYGLRWSEREMTLDKASDLIETFVKTPDPKTQQPRDLEDLGMLLLEAIFASGLIKRPTVDADTDDDAGTEGNENPEADATPSGT